MPNQKLLDIVICLDKKQQRKLLSFVKSPYFNYRSNASLITELLGIILKNKADYKAKKLQKKHLQKHFFPGKPFLENSKNAIDSLASELNKLVEQFIVQEELGIEIEKRSEFALALFYERTGNNTRFWPLIDKFRKKWDKQQQKNSEDYYLRFRMEERAAAFASFYPKTGKSDIEDVDKYLSKAFFTKKIELGIILSFSKQTSANNRTTEDQFLNFVEEIYPQYTSVHTELADLYYLAYKLWSATDDKALFLEFEEMLKKNEAFIPENERSNIYAFYRYFFGRNYELAGDTSLTEKLVPLYKEHLSKGYFFFSGGKMFHGTLKLLVNFGVKQNELDWVDEILTLITPEKILGTKYPEEIHSLCRAEQLFAQQEYEKSESMIVYRLFEDFNFSLSCDILLIKIYFHTQDDLLESRIRAMELKVRRAELSDFDKEAYLRFISLMRRIDKYLWLKDERKISLIKEDIKSDKPLIQREWLLKIIQG